MPILDRWLKNARVRVWNATGPNFVYPEIGDPELRVPGLARRPNLGLAFSGGGARSAAATLGQLRGLRSLGLLEKARYISCVSTSSFPNAALAYLPQNQDPDHFLGAVVDPADLVPAELDQAPKGSFAQTITDSGLDDAYFLNSLKATADEPYSRTIGDSFLRPFGLQATDHFFSLDLRTVQKILVHNPAMTAGDFYLMRSGHPFLILNAVILGPDEDGPMRPKFPFETTPLYVGVRGVHSGAGPDGSDLGGGYLEPFAFDSQAPQDRPDATGRNGVALGADRYRYTLADATGAGAAAPAEGLVDVRKPFTGYPTYNYWSPPQVGREEEAPYEFGDGGQLENLGLMPLLARKVTRIIAFVNTGQPLTGPGLGEIDRAIPPIFGLGTSRSPNTVFTPGKFLDLVDGLLVAKAAGTSLIFKDSYQVLENAFHGIQGGWEVEILWVYNERVPAWEASLAAEIQDQIGQGPLERFPNFKTMGENESSLFDLLPEQALLLAHLSCWNITANVKEFGSMV